MSIDGLGDHDQDGILDGEEFITGHNPTDPKDYFFAKIKEHDISSNEVALEFSSRNNHPDRRYWIYFSEDLQVWTEVNLPPILPSQDDTKIQLFTVPSDADSVFFNVECYLLK